MAKNQMKNVALLLCSFECKQNKCLFDICRLERMTFGIMYEGGNIILACVNFALFFFFSLQINAADINDNL